MSKTIKFSGICEDNIELSNDQTVATWKPVFSDGFALTKSNLRPGDVMKIKVEGSGRCDVGLIMGSKDKRKFSNSHEIRLHRKTCVVNIHQAGNQVYFEYDNRKEQIATKKKIKIWIVACIQYGDLNVELMSQNGSLSKFCSTDKGKNVRLSEEKSICSSICKNPGSKCFLSEQIRPSDKVLLKCSPVTEGGRKICKRELKLLVSNTNPLRSPNCSPILIATLGKQDCDGTLILYASDRRTLEYTTPSGNRNAQTLRFDITNGLWVTLELYGVEVGEVQKSTAETIEDVCGNEQVDSVCNDPRKKDLSKQSPENRRERHRDLVDELNIQERFPSLVSNIDTLSFCDHLFAHGIVTEGQMDAIHATFNNRGKHQANRELLKAMTTKKVEKSLMKEILKEAQHQHLLEMFFPPIKTCSTQ